MSARHSYAVVSPLSHSGTRYEPEDRIDLDPGEAADLIAAGVLRPPDDHDVRAAVAAARRPAPDPEGDIPTLIFECHGEAMLAIESLRRDIESLRRDMAAPATSQTPREGDDSPPDSGAGGGEPQPQGDDPAPGPEPGAGEPAAPTAEDRASRIVTAIAELVPGRDDHWTRSGKPEVAALRAITGFGDVTAADRDAAWTAFQTID